MKNLYHLNAEEEPENPDYQDFTIHALRSFRGLLSRITEHLGTGPTYPISRLLVNAVTGHEGNQGTHP